MAAAGNRRTTGRPVGHRVVRIPCDQPCPRLAGCAAVTAVDGAGQLVPRYGSAGAAAGGSGKTGLEVLFRRIGRTSWVRHSPGSPKSNGGSRFRGACRNIESSTGSAATSAAEAGNRPGSMPAGPAVGRRPAGAVKQMSDSPFGACCRRDPDRYNPAACGEGMSS